MLNECSIPSAATVPVRRTRNELGARAQGEDRHQDQRSDHAHMLAGRVKRHDRALAFEPPEGVNDQDGQECEHAQGSGSEPSPALGDDEGRARQLNDDREGVEEPGRLQAELAHLGHAARKIEELDEPARPERKGEQNPGGNFRPPV